MALFLENITKSPGGGGEEKRTEMLFQFTLYLENRVSD